MHDIYKVICYNYMITGTEKFHSLPSKSQEPRKTRHLSEGLTDRESMVLIRELM